MELIVLGIAVCIGLVVLFVQHKPKPKTMSQTEELAVKLPGYNCGGCGYKGCSGFAQALIDEQAKPEQCRPLTEDEKQVVLDTLEQIKRSQT